jgi:hypothetical protein
MTFREQLYITLVDKAVIGAFLAVGGFWLSKLLERFKSERALANEFAKQRLARIAAVWESLYKWEAEVIYQSRGVHKQIFAVKDDQISQAMEPLVSSLIHLIDIRAKEVRRLIEESKFWLGEAIYGRFQNYHAAIHAHLTLLLERPRISNSEQFEKELTALRQSISDYLTI